MRRGVQTCIPNKFSYGKQRREEEERRSSPILNGEEDDDDAEDDVGGGGGGWFRWRERSKESQKAEVDPFPLVPVT